MDSDEGDALVDDDLSVDGGDDGEDDEEEDEVAYDPKDGLHRLIQQTIEISARGRT
jgi:hypothetical protein